MVKRYGKPSYGYGSFVEERKLQNYKIPSKRKDTVYYEFEKDKQKIKDDYKKKLDAYNKALKERSRKYEEEYEAYYGKQMNKLAWFFCLIYIQ